jgi:hypothetical protein
MNRRVFWKCLAGASLLRAQDAVQLQIGGAQINVTFRGAYDLPQAALLDWITRSARAVTAYFGGFPVPQVKVEILQGRRSGVSNGRTFGEHGAHCQLSVGQHTASVELKDDWMCTHEMVHLAFPSVEEKHHWIEEGSATYVEPIARVKIGQLTAAQIWRDMARDMPQGLPEAGDQGLDRTHSWGRTYWGGAIFCLLADVGIRKSTNNAKGLQDALRAINHAGGSIEVEWPLEKALELGDRATGTKTLMDLYNQMASKPDAVDLPDLWKQLGVRSSHGSVTLDDHAPLAAIRSAITG